MDEREIVLTMRLHFESLFPKVCPTCKRLFATLREYVEVTHRLGPAISYDAELGNWSSTKLIGFLAHANCPCGSTLGLTTQAMPLPRRLEMLNWVRAESKQRGVSISDLLESLRDQVRQQVLSGNPPN
jgi:hypothetical protein